MHTFTLSLIKKTVLLFSVLFPLILIGIIGGGVCVYAAGNQFTVGANVTNDSTPPSTPAGVNAVPVSSSQINLDWAASTDNVSVGGYVVRRNGTILGTTTGISYSDPGLSPSTGYSYTVQAFDTSVNYSGESTVAYATTSASGGGGGVKGGTTSSGTDCAGSLEVWMDLFAIVAFQRVHIRRIPHGEVHSTRTGTSRLGRTQVPQGY
jgi:hypothetical protein